MLVRYVIIIIIAFDIITFLFPDQDSILVFGLKSVSPFLDAQFFYRIQ